MEKIVKDKGAGLSYSLITLEGVRTHDAEPGQTIDISFMSRST